MRLRALRRGLPTEDIERAYGMAICESSGRPRIKGEVEQLIVRMAKENRDWGYDRIAGALANLG